MKKTLLNSIFGLIFLMSLFALIFQGFAFPKLGEIWNIALRIIAAGSIQLLVLINIKSRLIRLFPIFLCAAVALWGGWLYLMSDAWANVTFALYFVDYCTPLLGSALTFIIYNK